MRESQLPFSAKSRFGSLWKDFHSDPLQSVAHDPESHRSTLKTHGIQRASRASE